MMTRESLPRADGSTRCGNNHHSRQQQIDLVENCSRQKISPWMEAAAISNCRLRRRSLGLKNASKACAETSFVIERAGHVPSS